MKSVTVTPDRGYKVIPAEKCGFDGRVVHLDAFTADALERVLEEHAEVQRYLQGLYRQELGLDAPECVKRRIRGKKASKQQQNSETKGS